MEKTSKYIITDEWPILTLLAAEDLDEATYALEVVEEIYATHQEPYAIILDARDGKKPNAVMRNMQNEFRVKYEDYVKKYCRGSALVTNSSLIKGVATAMFWFKKPDTVTKVFTDMDEAKAWVKALLQSET